MSIQEKTYNWTIYKITNPNGRVYIGKTVNLKKRMGEYGRLSNCANQPAIGASIRKYGVESHVFEVIDEFSGSRGYSSGKEIFWIRTYMSNVNKWPQMGNLNLTDGGEGTHGHRKSIEYRKAQSERLKKSPLSYWKGKRLPPHVIEIMSTSRKGKTPIHMLNGYRPSEEAKKKMSKAKLGKPNRRKGIKLTEEHKAKMYKPPKGVYPLCFQNIVRPTKKVRCDGLELIFDSVYKAAAFFGLRVSIIREYCLGNHKNPYGIDFRYG